MTQAQAAANATRAKQESRRPLERLVLRLTHADLSAAEIATQVGLTERSVVRIRARLRLRGETT